ncbi:sortilin-related receptor [Scaptodrosophila lebanonensis]|uniref:Sortilin-related receptor n=1 Tax=Drosophila lebanonensis TaxID=7225 RepID=A0A6J2TL23_DROLE|nr:sortilin-related receptor [Scaptodrosophila lebanonensis]
MFRRQLSVLLLHLIHISVMVADQNATGCGYRCGNGECIRLDQLCDGSAHCSDASDETAALCEKIWCPGYSFRCNYGACVASTAVCDGHVDCVDGSDEERWLCKAQMLQGNCDNWELHCLAGNCVPFAKLCDGKYDCLDGDDEDEALCEGVASTSTSASTVTEPEPVSSIMLAMRKRIYPLDKSTESNNSCVVPQLANIIVSASDGTVLQSGAAVLNSTLIYFACQTEHQLKGRPKNICQAPRWLHDFPYCESPSMSTFSALIALFSFLSVILLACIYRLRMANSQQGDDRILLVEVNKPSA